MVREKNEYRSNNISLFADQSILCNTKIKHKRIVRGSHWGSSWGEHIVGALRGSLLGEPIGGTHWGPLGEPIGITQRGSLKVGAQDIHLQIEYTAIREGITT